MTPKISNSVAILCTRWVAFSFPTARLGWDRSQVYPSDLPHFVSFAPKVKIPQCIKRIRGCVWASKTQVKADNRISIFVISPFWVDVDCGEAFVRMYTVKQ